MCARVCVCVRKCVRLSVCMCTCACVYHKSPIKTATREPQFLSCGNFGCVCVVCLFYPCVSVQETVNFVSCCFFHSETIIAIDSANISCFFILIFLSKVKN